MSYYFSRRKQKKFGKQLIISKRNSKQKYTKFYADNYITDDRSFVINRKDQKME